MSQEKSRAERLSRLPSLGPLGKRLKKATPEDLLASVRPPLEVETESAGLESTGFDRRFLQSPAPPESAVMADALRQEQVLVVGAGFEAVDKLAKNPDAVLTPTEETGLEAIVLLVGRPAIFIQDGGFMEPPAEWSVLNKHREAIKKTIRSVGRVEVTGHPRLDWIGTGFLVGPDVLMTNRHVAMEFTSQRPSGRWGITPGVKARVDFREELGSAKPSEFAIRSLIGIHGRYDMALFRMETRNGEALPPPLPMGSPEDASIAPGRNLYVIGYPAWDGRRNDPEPMQRLFSNIYNVKRLQPGRLMRHVHARQLFEHDCSTLGGNSGSGVVDLESHHVVGLHFGGRFREGNSAVALWQLSEDPLIRHAGLTVV